MSFRGFSIPSFPFCTIPKTENSEMKSLDFSLNHFDQTMSTLIKLPRFSSSEFSFCTTLKTENPEFDQNALRLVYIDQNDFDQSIILFRERSSYTI